ncbi:hypothetical protein GMJLKIPL_5823 [Methylobacterium isbiliense]|uniref:Uncharacterized protein n=1 Tax=Methylobacterium isbiliense TaxID=315478 RepID=A0ABQ4SKX0_9HYPH|nr:hypothetical protein GMJLKIPL_5823 [Methylobacterium isbiliense]
MNLVPAEATRREIVAGARPDEVVAQFAEQQVIPEPAEHDVVSSPAPQGIRTIRAHQAVVRRDRKPAVDVDREGQDLRDLRGREVVVRDHDQALAAIRQPRPERQALDVVECDPERAEVEEQLLADGCHAVELDRPVRDARRQRGKAGDIGGAGQVDLVELDRIADPRRERALKREQRAAVVDGQEVNEPVRREASGRRRSGRDRIRQVDELTRLAVGREIVAQDARRGAARQRGRGTVLGQRVLGRRVEDALVGRDRQTLEGEIVAHAGGAARGRVELPVDRQGADLVPVEAEQPDEGVREATGDRVGLALG